MQGQEPAQVVRLLVEMLRWTAGATGQVELGLPVPTWLLPPSSSLPILLRYLCDKVVPGNRVTIMGIYSIKKFGLTSNRGRDRVGVGIRSAYIRVLGIQVDTDGSGKWASPWAEPPSSLPWVIGGLPPGPVLTLSPTLSPLRQPG